MEHDLLAAMTTKHKEVILVELYQQLRVQRRLWARWFNLPYAGVALTLCQATKQAILNTENFPTTDT